MLKFFRTIPSEPRINRTFGFTRIFPRPVRDEIWVEKTHHPLSHRAVRYGIYRNLLQGSLPTTNHIAYQPAVGHGLRHAIVCSASLFYPYHVPPGQGSSVKSFNPCKSVIP
jgi:hypothetical protein